MTARALNRSGIKEPLESWNDATIERIVDSFLEEKFPFVIALNKIDHPDADKNIAKIAKMYPPERVILTSAISEVFLRKLVKQGFIRYTEGTDIVGTHEDLLEMGEADGGGLKKMDVKLKERLENVRDLVLFRFGGTGVVDVLTRAGEMLGLVPVFPVRSVQSGFGAEAKEGKVFRDCLLVKRYVNNTKLQLLNEKGVNGRRCIQESNGRRAVGICGNGGRSPSVRRQRGRFWKERCEE
jgi:ribosome-binding ATPase